MNGIKESLDWLHNNDFARVSVSERCITIKNDTFVFATDHSYKAIPEEDGQRVVSCSRQDWFADAEFFVLQNDTDKTISLLSKPSAETRKIPINQWNDLEMIEEKYKKNDTYCANIHGMEISLDNDLEIFSDKENVEIKFPDLSDVSIAVIDNPPASELEKTSMLTVSIISGFKFKSESITRICIESFKRKTSFEN